MFGLFVAIVVAAIVFGGKGGGTPHISSNRDSGGGGGGGGSSSPPPPKKYNLTLGYDVIPVFRPKFIYFEFNGLRPNVPHWIFFGGKQVNKWVNTSKTKSDYENAGRNSKILKPGDTYVTATAFPSQQGGASNGGGDDPLVTDATGKLSGFFYLQSNDNLSFSITQSGTDLVATDISEINLDKCKSYASATYRGFGQYENYYRGTQAQINDARAVNEALFENSTPSEEIT